MVGLAAGSGLALERQEVRQGAKRAPEMVGVDGSTGSQGHGLAPSRCGARGPTLPSLPARGRQRTANGPEGGAGAEEAPRPPPLPFPRPPPRAHLRGSHKGAGLPARGGADKGAAEPAALFLLPARGPRLPGRLVPPNSPPARSGPCGTRCAPTLRDTPAPRQSTRAHTDGWTHIHTLKCFYTGTPAHHTHVCTSRHMETLLGAQALTTLPTNTTRVCTEPSALSCRHRGTSIQVYLGILPIRVCPRSHPSTLTQVTTHRQTFKSAFLPVHRPCAAQTRPGRQAHSRRMMVVLTSAQRGQWPHQLHS